MIPEMWIAGTYGKSSKIVDTSDCMIEDSPVYNIIKDIKELIASFKYQPYDEDKEGNDQDTFFLRKGFSTKEIMLLLYSRSRISIKE